jgi:hypothetical protein
VDRTTFLLPSGAVLLLASMASCGLSLQGEQPVADGAAGGVDPADAGSDGAGTNYGGNDGGLFTIEDSGFYQNDAGFLVSVNAEAGTCDFNGTWGSLMTIDVAWAPQGLNVQAFILAPGSGQIKQWIKGVRVQHGDTLTDTTVVCGIALPDFKETASVGGETYGVVFPNSLFDNAYLPTFNVAATLSGLGTGATYRSTASAALLGLTMANPTTDPWPATVTTVTDPDKDGIPGVSIAVAQGGLYADVPVGIPGFFQPVIRANKLSVAIRQVTLVQGTVQDCDHISGTVTIPQIGGQYAINSHVVACEIDGNGGPCTTSGSSSQAAFVDNTQPVFTPSGTTTFQSARLPSNATCAAVRATLH